MAEDPDLSAAAQGPAPAETARIAPGLVALLGAAGATLVVLAGNLPGSRFGPDAAGLWPLARSGPVPGWQGPTMPTWARLSDQATGVAPGHLLPTVVVILGVALLGVGWILLWRRARRDPEFGPRTLAWIVGSWIAPLLLSAPFASQDVWHYGAEGRSVLDGLDGYRPAVFLGHSVWTVGVDPQWAARRSLYGPGGLDLSAFFVRVSGGRPWVAAECWRLTAIVGLVLCAWGIRRILVIRGGNAVTTATATVAAIANPAVLVTLVGGIHNDALMLGLTVAGVALAVSGRPSWGIVLCALGVAVKPSALIALGALAWWGWGSQWRARAAGALRATVVAVAVLVVSGLGVGGGFGWLTSVLSYRWVPGPWSLGPRLFGARSGWVITAIELAGTALAVVLVLALGRSGRWLAGVGWALAALALTTPTPEPWYLAWAVVLLACGGLGRRSERVGVLVLSAMMIGAVIPLGQLWWFSGEIVLAWSGLISLTRARRRRPTPTSRVPIPGGRSSPVPSRASAPVPAGVGGR